MCKNVIFEGFIVPSMALGLTAWSIFHHTKINVDGNVFLGCHGFTRCVQ